MTFSIHGLAVARGIAIGRAVLASSSRMEVVHYFIEPAEAEAEIDRLRRGAMPSPRNCSACRPTCRRTRRTSWRRCWMCT